MSGGIQQWTLVHWSIQNRSSRDIRGYNTYDNMQLLEILAVVGVVQMEQVEILAVVELVQVVEVVDEHFCERKQFVFDSGRRRWWLQRCNIKTPGR